MQIDWVAGSVRVLEGNVGKITVRETAVGKSAEVPFCYRVSNNTLSIAFAKNGTKVAKVSKDLTVTLPKGLKVDLDVDSVAAYVHVEASTLGKLNVETVSARVECRASTIDKVSVETTSGSVNMIVDSAPECEVETVSGNVSLNYKQMFRSLDVGSVSGGLTLTMPKDASFTMTFATETGSMSTGDFAPTISGKRYIVGTGDASIEVETVSGNVNLKSA